MNDNWIGKAIGGYGQNFSQADFGSNFPQQASSDGFDWANAMMGAGMGLSVADAFGSSTGGAPTAVIPMSPEGTELQKTLMEQTRKQYQGKLMPMNMMSIYMGRAKRSAQSQQRADQASMGGFGMNRTQSGTGLTGLLASASNRIEGAVAPTRWRNENRRTDVLNALRGFENIRNIEKQTPILRAQQDYASTGIGLINNARRGQALGDVARLAAFLGS